MKKIFIAGHKGMVGSAILKKLNQKILNLRQKDQIILF